MDMFISFFTCFLPYKNSMILFLCFKLTYFICFFFFQCIFTQYIKCTYVYKYSLLTKNKCVLSSFVKVVMYYFTTVSYFIHLYIKLCQNSFLYQLSCLNVVYAKYFVSLLHSQKV